MQFRLNFLNIILHSQTVGFSAFNSQHLATSMLCKSKSFNEHITNAHETISSEKKQIQFFKYAQTSAHFE